MVCWWTEFARPLLLRAFQAHQAERRSASRAGLTNEQPQPGCFFSQLLGVHLLEPSFLVFFVHGGETMQITARFSVNQKQTRCFLWKRPFMRKLIEDSQDAHVFCPRRRFFLESLMQSEPAVGSGGRFIGHPGSRRSDNNSFRMTAFSAKRERARFNLCCHAACTLRDGPLATGFTQS